MKYYATLNSENICDGISRLNDEVVADNLIELASYDTSVLGKMWTGSEWIENPNPPEPPKAPVTTDELSDKLDENQQLQLAGMQGQSDTYAAILAMQETINAQQQLILANMQGLSDVYSTLLALQTTETGTEA